MGLVQESLRGPSKEIRPAFSGINQRSSEIQLNRFPVTERGSEARLSKLSQMLFAERKKGEETEHQPQKETRTDGFEPFVNPQPSQDALFVNGYNGNFAQKMDLNRKGVERVLEIAHPDGKIFLTSLSSSRQRSLDGVNPDGSVAAKKNLTFEEKTEEDQKEINPLYRTVPIKDGWRIEINDGKIMEDLAEKRLTVEKRQEVFVKRFNKLLNKSLLGSICKEKLTTIKDKSLKSKAFDLVINPGLLIGPLAWNLLSFNLFGITFLTGLSFMMNAMVNLFHLFNKKRFESFENIIRTVDPNIDIGSSAYMSRKLDSLWEYFMPPVKIDKVARSWAFLAGKGRTLVKEIKQPENK